MKKLLGIAVILLSVIVKVGGHTGHPEDQTIDGIDNEVLIYLGILVGLFIVAVVAFIKGRQIANQSK